MINLKFIEVFTSCNHVTQARKVISVMLKFAYDRFLRPTNEQKPADIAQQEPIEQLEDEDCPASSFEPLKATQTQQNQSTKPDVPRSPNSQKEYEVEKVLRGKFINNKLYYLIKWKGFGNAQNTWEPSENLNQTLQDYLQHHPVRITGTSKVWIIHILYLLK